VVRQPETWAEVPDELILDWDSKRLARIEAEKAEKEALSRVLTPLKDAEGVQMQSGQILTYFEQTRSGIDQNTLKLEYPEIYSKVQTQFTYRVPRIKQGVAQ
jgi:predicted phage-related endonuclease